MCLPLMKAATPYCGACHIGFDVAMHDLQTRIRDALSDFYTDPLLLETLAAVMVQISEDDQDYVPNFLLKLTSHDVRRSLLTTSICNFFAIETITSVSDDEDKPFFHALPETATFVLSNRDIPSIVLETCTATFQDFFLRLRNLAEEDHDAARVIMFYGVAMALYEWKDRQRGGIPYDEETQEPIQLA